MKSNIALGIFWIGLILALYVGGWMIIARSIFGTMVLFSAGNGSLLTIILTILKCFGGLIAGCLITFVGYIIAAIIS